MEESIMFFNGKKMEHLFISSQFIKLRSGLLSLTAVILVMGFLLTTGGCSWFISKEDKPENTPVKIPPQGECFKHIPDTISRYMEQKLQSEQELHSPIFGCVDQSIHDFTQKTVGGNDPQSYTAKELKYFFQTNIVKKNISSDLMNEIMKLKVGLVGGTLERITKSEFEKIKQLLPMFEETMVKLYPHLGVLFFRSGDLNPNATPEGQDPVMAAINELKSALKTILTHLNLDASQYSLTDFYQLAHELSQFQETTESTSGGSQWPNHILAIKKLRTLLAGDSNDEKATQDNLTVYNNLIDGLKIALQFQSTIKLKHWTSYQDFHQIDGWVEDIVKLFKKSFELRNSQEISFEQIDAVLDELKNRDLWIEPLQLETAKLSYRQFILRFLNEDKTVTVLNSFSFNHFKKVELEYKAYASIQKNLIKIFQSESRQPIEMVRNQVQKIMDNNRSQKIPFRNREEFAVSQEALMQFLSLISTNEIRHWNAEGNVSVSVLQANAGDVRIKNNENLSWSFQELSFLNLIRIPTSVIMASYNEDLGDKNRRVSFLDQILKVEQIRAVYSEFKQFGSEMSLFDLRGEDTASRSTREADMFTPSGNGDYMVQFSELFDLFSILWSGGEIGVSQFKAFAQSESCELKDMDFFKKPYLQMECASRSFKKHFGKIFPQLPDFGNFIKTFNQDQWDSFYNDMLIVSRVCPTDNIGLETGDQRTMMVVHHYIEVLFSLYDTNRDGRFDESEVTVAFPRFQKFFKEQSEKRLLMDISEVLFKFVVLVGRQPSAGASGLKEIIAFKLSTDKGTADRQKLAKVFAALKADISTLSSTCNVQAH